ncbi:C40 family peptidase [Nonomuraea sp. NPDC050404]|uniref:C40 family peptidase n=1 Tax=Nonomuraea sp. NPDC050404 TaxID=3155783 RepID=UPI0033FA945B
MARAAIALATGAAGLILASPAAHATAAKDQDPTTLTGADIKRVREESAPTPSWKVALAFAMDKRGTPYVWGGTSKRGYDCSGLMLRAYEAAGIELPRTARQQYGAFDRKIAWKDLKPGDLVFFSGLGHVGMISKPGYMVHAPSSGDVVKEEKLSDWRRQSFVGAVRPDPQGVRRWTSYLKEREAPAPSMPTAVL